MWHGRRKPQRALMQVREVAALHDMLSQAVTLLLEDPVNAVKQVLVHYGAARLAVFFGRQRANDVLLSHMITFLNDKTDAQLRHATRPA